MSNGFEFKKIEGKLDYSGVQHMSSALDDDNMFADKNVSLENKEEGTKTAEIVVTQNIPAASKEKNSPFLKALSKKTEDNTGKSGEVEESKTPKDTDKAKETKSVKSLKENLKSRLEDHLGRSSNNSKEENKDSKAVEKTKKNLSKDLNKVLEEDEEIEDESEELFSPEEIRDCLDLFCNKLGVDGESAWYNHFVASLNINGAVFSSEIESWVSAIKHERATASHRAIKEILTNLNTQVVRLTAQVKALSDTNGSLAKQNESLLNMVDSMRKNQEEWLNTQLELRQGAIRGGYQKEKGKLTEEMSDENASSGSYYLDETDDETSELLVSHFLTLLKINSTQIQDPRVRMAVRSLFPMKILVAACEHGIREADKPKALEKLKEWILNN
ncbi:phosphoprotein [Yerba mate chlorosis-associated virus]|uniref:Phosphoprotein n=1 Tax=Yerba mate chlorosis-associated virus TaxID=2487100 RepID=A0A1W5RYH2_9RHAB|nr:phosphoprotein [Yerba mate chlorosis-associated virus]ARA91088.1 phosphoprotein [Yerba mate chlorosis-associated virus]